MKNLYKDLRFEKYSFRVKQSRSQEFGNKEYIETVVVFDDEVGVGIPLPPFKFVLYENFDLHLNNAYNDQFRRRVKWSKHFIRAFINSLTAEEVNMINEKTGPAKKYKM